MNKQKRHRYHTGKTGCDIGRATPRQQGAHGRSGNWNDNGGCEQSPDKIFGALAGTAVGSGLAGLAHGNSVSGNQAGSSTKSAFSVLSFELAITGRRKTVLKSSLS